MTAEERYTYQRIKQAFSTMEKEVNRGRLLVPTILWEVDPYSAVTYALNKALDLAENNSGKMAEVEHDNLLKMKAALVEMGERVK